MPNKLINKQKKKYLITPALYFNYSIWRFSLLFYIKFNSEIIKTGKKKSAGLATILSALTLATLLGLMPSERASETESSV